MGLGVYSNGGTLMTGTKTFTSDALTSTADNEYRIGAPNARKHKEYFGHFKIDEMIFYAKLLSAYHKISSINWKRERTKNILIITKLFSNRNFF